MRELTGAISEGETMTEALQNIREAANLICEVLSDYVNIEAYSHCSSPTPYYLQNICEFVEKVILTIRDYALVRIRRLSEPIDS